MIPLVLAAVGLVAGSAQSPTLHSTFDSDGVSIYYSSLGEGEVVLLIHGWMGDSTMWGRDAAGNTKLSSIPGFRVVALDCRGHGKSTKPRGIEAYGNQMALDIVRLLDHLRVERAHLVGYSMGAFIAAKVVADHPDRVTSVIYGGQAPLLLGESGSSEVEAFARAVKDGKGLGSYMKHVRPSLTDAQAEALATFMFAGKDVNAFAAAGLSFKGLEVSLEALKRAAKPTLFLYGSQEADATLQRLARLRASIPCQVKVIEGADHVTTLTSKEFGPAIVAFIKANKAR